MKSNKKLKAMQRELIALRTELIRRRQARLERLFDRADRFIRIFHLAQQERGKQPPRPLN